jgi:hypothetical protein
MQLNYASTRSKDADGMHSGLGGKDNKTQFAESSESTLPGLGIYFLDATAANMRCAIELRLKNFQYNEVPSARMSLTFLGLHPRIPMANSWTK